MTKRLTTTAMVLGLVACLATQGFAQSRPSTQWRPASASNYAAGRAGSPVRYVVLHTVEGSALSAVNWYSSPGAPRSMHYVIAFDGTIFQCVSDRDTARHSNNGAYDRESIGIELEGWMNRDAWTNAQYRSLAALTRWICATYGVRRDRDRLIGHSQVPGASFSDPGPFFNWSYFIQLVADGSRTSNDDSVLSLSHWGRPASDYRRVSFRGATVNRRTRELLLRAEAIMRALGGPSSFTISQGSYSPGWGPSAGTHDGGGVVDIRCSAYSSATIDRRLVRALRMAGFAAWRRGVNDGFPVHIHAVALGDREMSRSARSQVTEYFQGGDGLRGSRTDIHLTAVGHNIGRPVPVWARR